MNRSDMIQWVVKNWETWPEPSSTSNITLPSSGWSPSLHGGFHLRFQSDAVSEITKKDWDAHQDKYYSTRDMLAWAVKTWMAWPSHARMQLPPKCGWKMGFTEEYGAYLTKNNPKENDDDSINREEWEAARAKPLLYSRPKMVAWCHDALAYWPQEGDAMPDIPNGCGWSWHVDNESAILIHNQHSRISETSIINVSMEELSEKPKPKVGDRTAHGEVVYQNELESVTDSEGAMTVHLTKTLEPISKYQALADSIISMNGMCDRYEMASYLELIEDQGQIEVNDV